jgi:hypothetical protein
VVISGRRPLPCQDVASDVWPRSAASAARRNTTRERGGAAPEGLRGWDTVSGKVLGSGVLGWLGERTSTQHPPAVRRKNVCQGTVGRDGEEKSKGYVLLPGKARGILQCNGSKRALADVAVTGWGSPGYSGARIRAGAHLGKVRATVAMACLLVWSAGQRG